jgi:methionyl-tRNA formyltransferase
MRIVFAGSPDVAVPSLIKVASNFDVTAVLTNPDKITGRGRKVRFNPVKTKALELNLDLLQPESLNGEVRAKIELLKPDLLVVFAYGKIFGPKFLELFPLGGINIHPSLLPMYRGSSPIISAILKGDKETGISIQKVNLEMDTGDIINQKKILLRGDESTESLSSYVSEEGSELLIETLKKIESGGLTGREQDRNNVSYCTKIVKEDGRINWSESALKIDRKIRAYSPWPRAFTLFKDKNLMLLKACIYTGETELSGEPGTVLGFDKSDGILIQTGDGILSVKFLQLQSKKANDWKSFINGTQDFISCILGGE